MCDAGCQVHRGRRASFAAAHVVALWWGRRQVVYQAVASFVSFDSAGWYAPPIVPGAAPAMTTAVQLNAPETQAVELVSLPAAGPLRGGKEKDQKALASLKEKVQPHEP